MVIGDQPKMTAAYWMPLNKTIMSTGADGIARIFDPESGEQQDEKQLHEKAISAVSFSKDKTMFLTASKDHWAKLWDTATLEQLKGYETDRPVNGCALSPIKEHVLIGGGQDAMSVTTTSAKAGKFETRFFHMVTEEEFGRVSGHFGPVNVLAISPDGTQYSSGAEDGYIRVHDFDDDYLKMEGRKEAIAFAMEGADDDMVAAAADAEEDTEELAQS